MEKITRWMFCVVVVILLLYAGWRYRSVSLQLRDAETVLAVLQRTETDEALETADSAAREVLFPHRPG